MGLIDSILNLAALLLWFSWRSGHFDPLSKRKPATLVGTLRPAEPRRVGNWFLFASLGLLLLIRAFFYWEISSAAEWTPKLDLGLVALAFRNDRFGAVLLFSILSFVRVATILYFWLLIVVVLNRRSAEPDAIQKMVSLQLGKVARWPRTAQIALPPLAVAVLWISFHPLLVWTQVAVASPHFLNLVEQGLIVSLGVLISLKYLLPVLLMLYLVVSYVYLGSSPFWDFVSTTSSNLLRPLRRLPLRFAKVDLSPLVGVVVILLLLHVLPNLVLEKVLGHDPVRNPPYWPQ